MALLAKLDAGGAEEFHRAFVELYEGYRKGDRVCAPRRYLLTLGGGADRRGGRAPAGADPRRHVEPARQRDRGGGAAARLPRGRRRRVRAVREGARAREPRRAASAARGGGPSLALLSHTDVVPADAREWSVDPFGGELRDGFVWGRGALDMKGQVAASAVALASLAREGWRGRGDLVFVAAADEEVGDGFGLEWLVRRASRRLPRGLRDQRGRRRPRRDRRARAVPVRRRPRR